MSGIAAVPGLPGGVGVSRLRVYDWPTADGLSGGSPHLHAASSEAYIVLAGRGRVQTLSAHGLATTELEPGTVAWFTPGTVHRLINDDGGLDILTVMSNAGLPEAGDAVLTFPPEILADPQSYRRHAALPASGTEEELADAARRRRDLALDGFARLCARAETDLDGALRGLYEAATTLVAGRIPDWRAIVEAGPSAQVSATLRQLELLESGSAGNMRESRISTAADSAERFGMCGRLTVWSGES
ncbi:cupin domain-containing protein [Humibacter sp.]|uniref:cupin domain-containing protein n=1 Tax=Humibacter sp. TaxID=1940291 RepID=UPI003F802501